MIFHHLQLIRRWTKLPPNVMWTNLWWRVFSATTLAPDSSSPVQVTLSDRNPRQANQASRTVAPRHLQQTSSLGQFIYCIHYFKLQFASNENTIKEESSMNLQAFVRYRSETKSGDEMGMNKIILKHAPRISKRSSDILHISGLKVGGATPKRI